MAKRKGEGGGWEGLPGFQLPWISLLGFPWEALPALIVNRGDLTIFHLPINSIVFSIQL